MPRPVLAMLLNMKHLSLTCCCVILYASFGQTLIESSNATAKTFLYFGYALANLNGGLNTKTIDQAAEEPLTPSSPAPIFTPNLLQSIVTLPQESTPNQVPFPFDIIPPTSSGNVFNTRDINDRAAPGDAEFVPPTASEPFDIVRPLTISPSTAAFPSFDPLPFPTAPPSLTPSSSMSSGLVQRQPVESLAQTFPQTFPLPTAPGNAPNAGCSCVPSGTCRTRTVAGVIVDTRIVTQNPGLPCQPGQQYCCSSTTPAQPQQDTCGFQNFLTGVFPQADQAAFGEFPWSAIILNANNNYVGGGVLITNSHVLTAAHLVATSTNANLKIRLGDWDIAGTLEPIGFVEFNVANIVTHPFYTPVTLLNDIAVITLATPAVLLDNPTPQVNTACLPAANSIFTGLICSLAGWGRESWTGAYQSILKKVEIPVIGSNDCQASLRRTKLGRNWNLDTNSFICAGGEAAKDACTGDGGNALVCLSNGRFVVAGITAGGVECGLPGVPGLYVNVASYLDWINQQIFVPPPVGNIDPRRGG